MLTPMRQRFVDAYLTNPNATQAAIKAGYSEKTARSQGQRLLTNVDIKAAIDQARAVAAERARTDASRTLEEVGALAFSDVGQILDFSGPVPRLRPGDEIPEAARRAIASIKLKRYTEGTGDQAREAEVVELRLWNKLGALEKLMKHLGLLTQRVEHTGKAGKPIRVEVEDQVRREFFAELGRVLAPYPEAKAAVGALLEKQVKANEAQGRMEAGER
jgi:phage terminase small subunit